MSSSASNGRAMNIDREGELVLIYLTEYRALEQALVRAGFTKASLPPGNVQPDWARFARHIERRFHRGSSPDLQGAVSYLLYQAPELELCREGLHSPSAGQMSSPQGDILKLAELIQATGHKLIYNVNFRDTPVCDFEHVMAALLVVVAWSCCDPRVESLLAHLQ